MKNTYRNGILKAVNAFGLTTYPRFYFTKTSRVGIFSSETNKSNVSYLPIVVSCNLVNLKFNINDSVFVDESIDGIKSVTGVITNIIDNEYTIKVDHFNTIIRAKYEKIHEIIAHPHQLTYQFLKLIAENKIQKLFINVAILVDENGYAIKNENGKAFITKISLVINELLNNISIFWGNKDELDFISKIKAFEKREAKSYAPIVKTVIKSETTNGINVSDFKQLINDFLDEFKIVIPENEINKFVQDKIEEYTL